MPMYTIQGSSTDVWIFQIAQGLTMASSKAVILANGAQNSNIFWQVTGQTTIGTTAHFEGIVLCATAVVLQTGASMNGRILAQTAVTLDAVTITASVQTAAAVNLSTLVNYVILSEVGVATSGMTNITGNLGISPANSTAYTGFGSLSNKGQYATSASVDGRLYASDMATPTPSVLASAISDMKAAYANASGRTPPDFVAVGAGGIGGLYLTPGLYSWTTSVVIGTNLTLLGNSTNIWIFQIAGSLTMANGTAVILVQGAQAANVVWQVAGAVMIGPKAQFQGILLCASPVVLQAQAGFNGRILSQANVTLDAASVQPAGPASTTGPNSGALSSGALPARGNAGLFATAVAALILSVGLGVAGGGAEPAATAATIPSVAAVNLRTAGNFVILCKAGVSTTGTTAITGNLGISPIATTAFTGFGLTLASGGQYATCPAVTGHLYGADMAAPTPHVLTVAISDMETAYTDAAGRTRPHFIALGAGSIGGLTLTPGLYEWSTPVVINADVILAGGATDVWILQVGQTLTMASGSSVRLAHGARAENIFWQVAGAVTVGTGAHFQGIILAGTMMAVQTGATVKGRILAQTAVTLDAVTLIPP